MTGNCLKGSRAILSFDSTFDSSPHLQLIKELFSQVFSVPKYHQKSKPFVDHIMTFSVIDHRIWIRNFQIIEQNLDKSKKSIMLAEIGPRLVLNIIKIFESSFRGEIIYENPHFVSPNSIRSTQRQSFSGKYKIRKENKILTRERKRSAVLPQDEVNEVFRVKGE